VEGKHVHPAVFGVLVIPFGLAVGYSTVAVPFLLKARGMEIGAIATVTALAGWPHGWKFLWAPALDAGWKRRSWFIGAVLVTAAALAATNFVDPIAHLTLYTAVLAIGQAAVATSSAAVDALMAIALPNEKKGAAAGWSMAGNLGGTGVGGALALWLAQHVSPGLTASVLATACAACIFPALLIVERPPEKHPLGRAFINLAKDVWQSIKTREGWTGLLICLSPVGTGAATGLFSAVAEDYHAGEWHVELVNGVLGGIVGAIGCLIGGYLADRMNRRLCYVLAGALTSVFAIAMAFGPATPRAFAFGCLAYQFANGIAYAAFAAFVLEMIGHGPGVTTKYALLVGASNQAISYVQWLDGKGYDWGAKRAIGGRAGMLGMDVLSTVMGIAILGSVVFFLRRSDRSRANPAPIAIEP
jgi:MFS family permease